MPRASAAQSAPRIALRLERVPLRAALDTLAAQTRADFVYAESLVAGQTATCRYVGTDPTAALACVLRASGLVAQRIEGRGARYVLTAAPAAPSRTRRASLSGFVVDADTGERLPGAHVYIRERREGSVTNDAGFFTLPDLPAGLHAVRVSYLGYTARDTTLGTGNRPRTVALRSAAVEGEGILVERARDAEEAQPPGLVSVPVPTLETLPTFGGEPDLFQALGWMPGVSKAGGVGGGLIVRGGEPDQNLYLIDGAPVYHPWHAFSLVSTFQTETFKDIQLYRGAFPSAHGGRLASVLDAELKDGRRDHPRATGAVSLLAARFVFESPITPTTSFMIAGRSSYLDRLVGSRHPVEAVGSGGAIQRDTLRTGYYFYDWSAKATWQASRRGRFSASFYTGRDVLDLRLPFDLSLDFSSWLRPADLFFELGQRWGNRVISARYQHVATPRLFVEGMAYWSVYEARETALIQPTTVGSVQTAYSVRVRDAGAHLDATFAATAEHRFEGGLRLANRGFRSDLDALLQRSPQVFEAIREDERAPSWEAVAYAEHTWRPTRRIQVQPGLRASTFTRGRYVHLAPRLSAQVEALPGRLYVRAGAGRQVQYLHRLRDRYAFLYDLVSARWVPAGPDVPPATAWQASAEAEARPLEWLRASLAAYTRRSRGALLPQDAFQDKDGLTGPGIETGTLLAQYTRGEGLAYGVEGALHVTRGPWDALVSATRSRTKSRAQDLGESTFRPARYDAPRRLDAYVRRTRGRFEGTVSLTWRSGYPETVPAARYDLRDPVTGETQPFLHRPEINNGRLPAYFRADVFVAYRFRLATAKWRATLQLYNVTARRNVLERTYDPASPIVRADERRGVPILPLIGVEVEL